MVVVVVGATGPTLGATEPPLSVTECGSSVWLAIVMSTGPAPNFAGDTVTLSGLDHARELDGHGLTRVVLEILVAAAASDAAECDRQQCRGAAWRLPSRGHPLRTRTLTEPDRPARSHERVELRLDPCPDVLGDPLHERHVLGVVGAVSRTGRSARGSGS